MEQRLLAEKHLKFMLEKEDKLIEAIAFNIDLKQWPNYRCQTVNVAYRLDVNEYNNKRRVQLIIEHLEAV
jgi:single-stranded-DNA-specific exonuclease